jgi:hypothetical protein
MIPSKSSERKFAPVKETFFLLVILCFAAVLYRFNLTYSDIWVDESSTKALARHPFFEMLQLVANDFHPPLYFAAIKLFTAVLGSTDFTIRLFSVLGALSTLLLCWTAGGRVFGKIGALYWCLLLLALPMPGLYSHIARMYTWAAFVTTGVFLHAVLYARANRKSDLVRLGLFSLMAAYLHYYCLIAAFWTGLVVMLYLFAIKNRAWRSMAAMGGAVFVLFLPWLVILLSQAQAVRKDYWIPALSWPTLLACYAQPFGGNFRFYIHSFVMLAVIYGLTIASVCWAALSAKNENKLPLGLSLIVFHSTLLTVVGVSLLMKPILVPRYLMSLMPLLMVPPAVALLGWKLNWLKAIVFGGVLFCGTFIVFSESRFSYGPYRQSLDHLSKARPEARKIVHLTEVTAGPFYEYGRGGPWSQYYLKNNKSSWYSNMDAFEGMAGIKSLDAILQKDETFCLVVFDKLPLNQENIGLVLSQCQTVAVDEVVDEKPYSGVKMKLYILKYAQ